MFPFPFLVLSYPFLYSLYSSILTLLVPYNKPDNSKQKTVFNPYNVGYLFESCIYYRLYRTSISSRNSLPSPPYTSLVFKHTKTTPFRLENHPVVSRTSYEVLPPQNPLHYWKVIHSCKHSQKNTFVGKESLTVVKSGLRNIHVPMSTAMFQY